MKNDFRNMIVRSPEGDAGAGGGAAGSPDPSAASAAPVAGAEGAAAAGATGASGSTGSTGTTKEPLPEGSVLGAAQAEGATGATGAAETDEQKAERLKNETPEQKTEREAKEKTDGEAAAKIAEEKKAELVKSYDALKLPDGMPADQPAFLDFKAEAAELGLPANAAQRLVDKIAPKMQEALEAPYKAWADMQAEWIASIKADKDMGGPNYQRNIAVCAKGIDALFPDVKENAAFREVLAVTGMGNNPLMFKAMMQWGKLSAEGRPTLGRTPAEKPSLAEKAYPSMAGGTKE